MGATFDRRTVLRWGLTASGLAVATPLLSGCGDPRDDRVSFLNWQDYIGEEIIDGFESATGLSVRYTTYESNDELADRLVLAGVSRRGGRKATSFDLIVPSDNVFARFRDQDRLRRLDPEFVTEELLANLDPVFRSLESDPENRYSVPWATGTTGIGYDTTVFDEPPGWDVFLDTAFAGRLSLLDERREAFAAALFSLGEDPNSADPDVIAAAEAQLVAMAANAVFNSGTYLDDLADGNLVAAQAFSVDLVQARDRNPNLAFVIPEQGGTRWIDLICIPDDAPNAEGASRFIAYYLDPAVAAANSASLGVDTGSAAARELIPAEVLADPVVFPPDDVVARLSVLRDLGDDESLYVDAWERVRGDR